MHIYGLKEKVFFTLCFSNYGNKTFADLFEEKPRLTLIKNVFLDYNNITSNLTICA